jgi:type IV pilus assembly protein PilP
MHGNNVIKILAMVVMASLLSCSESPPPVSRTKVVREKIATQPAQPGAPQTQKTRPNTQPNTQTDKATQPTPPVQAQNESAQGTEKVTSDLIKASLAIAATYDPKGRFDPFEPLFKEQSQAPPTTSTSAKREKRIPQTPLERVALSQLKLSAVLRAPSGNRALVVDATGKGYVVEIGTYIGLNSGKVIRIDKDRIVVEEEIENVLGELTVQNTELKLQKPAGEL